MTKSQGSLKGTTGIVKDIQPLQCNPTSTQQSQHTIKGATSQEYPTTAPVPVAPTREAPVLPRVRKDENYKKRKQN